MVTVSLSTATPGAAIRSTTDGSQPTPSSGFIGSAFTLDGSATVNAVAFSDDLASSPVSSASLSVLSPLPFWRFVQGLAANGSQDLPNPSRDGVANLLKYAFNMAPNAGGLTIPNIAELPENGTAGLPFIYRDAQGHLVIEFIRRKPATDPGITDLVETSGELTNLQPLSLTNASVVSIDANWERVTITDPTITSKRFGRVRVQIAP